MFDKADKDNGDTKNEKEKISIYEALQVLIEHGHDKYKLLNEYSREELSIFYEKCIRTDTLKDARFIESVSCGIGMAFGGSKEVRKLLKEMRS